MKNDAIRRMCLTLVLVVFPLTGCASNQGPPPATGFLSSYASLKQDGENTLRYIGPDLGKYNSFIVDPVRVYSHPGGESEDVSPETLEELAIYARGSIIKELKDRYSIVNAPGPGVARIRMALTNISSSTPAMNILPTMRMMGGGLGGASMEAEVVDSQSGEQLAALIESRLANRLNLPAGWSEVGDSQAVIDHWSETLRKRLDDSQN